MKIKIFIFFVLALLSINLAGCVQKPVVYQLVRKNNYLLVLSPKNKNLNERILQAAADLSLLQKKRFFTILTTKGLQCFSKKNHFKLDANKVVITIYDKKRYCTYDAYKIIKYLKINDLYNYDNKIEDIQNF